MGEGPRIYNLFPPLVGTVDDWTKHLDRIGRMGFNWVYVNPWHKTGFSHSLYAVKDYFSLNPKFLKNSKKSPDKLIEDFVAAAEKRGIGVMMDLVVNHTAKDADLTEEHPEWFEREADGSLMSPFAVDPADTRKKTVWTDLAAIDFSDRPERRRIVKYFQGVIRHHLGLGIRGFRCDAAYKVPSDVWRALMDDARSVSPDAVFVAENLGAMLEQVEALRPAGFDYLFNSAKWWDFESSWLLDQYEKFRSFAPSITFPETHDTERLRDDLQAEGISKTKDVERSYRQAYLFAAVFSTGVMIPIGFEYGFRRKLHVVNTTPRHWEKKAFDLEGFIADVNGVKASLPVLNDEGPQRHIRLGDRRVAALLRRGRHGSDWVLTVVNRDRFGKRSVRLDPVGVAVDRGREVTPGRDAQRLSPGAELTLDPGEVRVFADR